MEVNSLAIISSTISLGKRNNLEILLSSYTRTTWHGGTQASTHSWNRKMSSSSSISSIHILGWSLQDCSFYYQQSSIIQHEEYFSIWASFQEGTKLQILQVFKCLCYPFLIQQGLSKLDNKSTYCIFLGYSEDHNAYRCYDISSKKVKISRREVWRRDISIN